MPKSAIAVIMEAPLLWALVRGKDAHRSASQVLLLAGLVCSLAASELTVGPNESYKTIASALAAARVSDRITVQPGIYKENLVWPKVHGLELVSAGGAEHTIIEGDGRSPVIIMAGKLKWDTVLDGFTIRNGGAGFSVTQKGAGLQVTTASPTIRNCVVAENMARPYRGSGGVFLLNSGALFEHNRVSGNRYQSDTLYGGGLTIWEGKPMIRANVVENNSGDDAKYFPRGAGLHLRKSQAEVTGNLVQENTAASVGSAFYFSDDDASCIYGNRVERNLNNGPSRGAVAVKENANPLVGGNFKEEPNAIFGNRQKFVRDPEANLITEGPANLAAKLMSGKLPSILANWWGGTDDEALEKALPAAEFPSRPPAATSAVPLETPGPLR